MSFVSFLLKHKKDERTSTHGLYKTKKNRWNSLKKNTCHWLDTTFALFPRFSTPRGALFSFYLGLSTSHTLTPEKREVKTWQGRKYTFRGRRKIEKERARQRSSWCDYSPPSPAALRETLTFKTPLLSLLAWKPAFLAHDILGTPLKQRDCTSMLEVMFITSFILELDVELKSGRKRDVKFSFL